MQAKYNNFIGMYENVFPDYYCQHLINEFERIRLGGHCGNRQNSEGAKKHIKHDEFYFLNVRNHDLSPFHDMSSMSIFWNGLQNCYNDYSEEYSIIKDGDLKCTSVKMQKTNPGGGYHIWHSEQNNGPQANRGLVYILYLNTLCEECAGETEFLYQKLRIPPKENSLIIWPAAFTHAHRGNVVHGEESKYVVTGWFYYE
jgi:hypothetical protein